MVITAWSKLRPNPKSQTGGKGKVDSGIGLKVHKIENFFDTDFGNCVISLLVMHK